MRVTLGCLLSGCLAYGEILHSSGLVIYNRFPVLVQEERQTAFGVILVWVEHPALPFAVFFYLVLEGGGSDVLALLKYSSAQDMMVSPISCLSLRCCRRSPGACTTPNLR